GKRCPYSVNLSTFFTCRTSRDRVEDPPLFLRRQDMKQRVLNLFLILVAVLGGLLAWQSGRERGRLQAECARLLAITGDLSIDDPSKVYIRALDTREPLHFAWRVYLPPNYQQILWYSEG